MAADVSAGMVNLSSLTTCDPSSLAMPAMAIPADGRVRVVPVKAELGSDNIRVDFEIKFPKKEKPPKPAPPPKKEVAEKKTQGSQFSVVFVGARRFPQPVYFQEVDCVGLPGLLTGHECARIVEHAEAQGFSRQHRHDQLRLHWSDVLDPFLCEGIWSLCGLGEFLDKIMVDGMVPCGLNDVVRIQKYLEGDLFGRHTDQPVRRKDGRVSKYSLRVFLNGVGEDSKAGAFTGGLSAFHVNRCSRPVVFEPEEGLALLYPQGELCTVQEETKVLSGCKYVLRADVLFCRPEDLGHFRG